MTYAGNAEYTMFMVQAIENNMRKFIGKPRDKESFKEMRRGVVDELVTHLYAGTVTPEEEMQLIKWVEQSFRQVPAFKDLIDDV